MILTSCFATRNTDCKTEFALEDETKGTICQIVNRRGNQEDAFLFYPFPLTGGDFIAIAADGLGGHDNGEKASETLINTFVKSLKKDDLTRLDIQGITHWIINRIDEAGKELAKTKDNRDTTAIVVARKSDSLIIVNVGDSSAVLISKELRFLYKSKTQGIGSWVQSTVRSLAEDEDSDAPVVDLVKLTGPWRLIVSTDGLVPMPLNAYANGRSLENSASDLFGSTDNITYIDLKSFDY